MKNNLSAIVEQINGIDDYRTQLGEQILPLLPKITSEYRDFVFNQTPDDVKSFSAYQTACRAALTHLQLLIKIASWAQPNIHTNSSSNYENSLYHIISDAKEAIGDYCYFE